MAYADLYKVADSAPLADALTKIAAIIDRSESDPEEMMKMLDEIDDAVSGGRTGWLASIAAAQAEELRALREAR